MYNEDRSTRYNPHANVTLKNNDGIRMPILQPDLYVLKRKNFLYVKRKLSLLEEESKDIIGDAILYTNSVAIIVYIRWNSLRIERCWDPLGSLGITIALKNYSSLSREGSRALENAAWKYVNYTKSVHKATTDFNLWVPLDTLLGFREDYKRVLINACHKLVLIRARDDTNALYSTAALKSKLKLHEVQWSVPHVTSKQKLACCVFSTAANRSAWVFDSGISTNIRYCKQLRNIFGW